MTQPKPSGVWAPAITPFKEDLSPDPIRFSRHARWLLANGCSGLAAFGTNSEANSLSVEERMSLLEFLVEDGVPPHSLMPGTGCCALTDSVRLTAHATQLGCAGALMLPPFYYKGVTDDGLFRNFAEIIERVGDARLRLYLYHIPPVAQVAISIPLIERLLKSYPQAIAGLKDSSGDWNNTQTMLDAFRGTGFDVFAGSEVFLLRNMQHGGVGCISATANVNPAAIHRVFACWQQADAGDLQTAISATRAVIQQYPMIPALKAIAARAYSDPGWVTVRPPLMELTEGQRVSLGVELDANGFALVA